MLSEPDFQQKQIIFIQIEEYKELAFKFSNDNLVVYSEGKIKNKLSLHKILSIFVIGSFTVTSNLVEKCISFGISIFLLRNNLEVYAEIESSAKGNYLLRHQQYNLDDRAELAIAKQIVINKTLNQFLVLKKLGYPTHPLEPVTLKEQIETAIGYQVLLGIEGEASKYYFEHIFNPYNWYGRRPRTKSDINNLLLDIGYTYLFHFVDSILRLYGFDTYKGVYHKLFFQRKSLACDLMEIFRPVIDYTLIKAWHLNQINEADFVFKNPNFELPWKHNQQYSSIFLTAILDIKLEIFEYIRDYYRFFMNPTDNSMPVYKSKIR